MPNADRMDLASVLIGIVLLLELELNNKGERHWSRRPRSMRSSRS